MKKVSTLFLRIALVLMGLVAAAVCIFALPSIHTGAAAEYPGVNILLYVFTGGLYLSAIPFFIALYQAWKLLRFIDTNQAFSQLSVSALKTIKYCGIIISICYAACIPFLFHVAQLDDAPGLGLIALVFTCAPLVISTFAAVLQKLLENAINIKSENDLTI